MIIKITDYFIIFTITIINRIIVINVIIIITTIRKMGNVITKIQIKIYTDLVS